MNKRTFFTISIFILIFVLATILFFIFRGGGEGEVPLPDEGTQDPFDLPVGERPINQPTVQDRDNTISPTDSVGTVPLYRQISSSPIAGYGWFDSEDAYPLALEQGTTTEDGYDPDWGDVVRYIERGRGHVFEAYTDTLGTIRISNTTIPKVYEGFIMGDGGRSILFRYLNDSGEIIKTYAGRLEVREDNEEVEEDEQTLYAVEGTFLSDNITHMDLWGNNLIFYIRESGGGVEGVVFNLTSDEHRIVFTPDTSEWIPLWRNAGSILLTTKASGFARGYSYTLTPPSSVLDREVGAEEGLTTLPEPDGDRILYTTTPRDELLELAVYNTATGEMTDLSLITLSEKCAWSRLEADVLYCAAPSSLPDGIYPDDWYKGVVSFNDLFWKVDVSSGRTQLLLTPSDFDEPNVDATNLTLSEDEAFLYFVDKKTGTLWSIQLPE